MTTPSTVPVWFIRIPATAAARDSISKLRRHISASFAHALTDNDPAAFTAFIISGSTEGELQAMLRGFMGETASIHLSRWEWYEGTPAAQRFPDHLEWRQPE